MSSYFSIFRNKSESAKISLLVVCKEREIKITASDDNLLYNNKKYLAKRLQFTSRYLDLVDILM